MKLNSLLSLFGNFSRLRDHRGLVITTDLKKRYLTSSSQMKSSAIIYWTKLWCIIGGRVTDCLLQSVFHLHHRDKVCPEDGRQRIPEVKDRFSAASQAYLAKAQLVLGILLVIAIRSHESPTFYILYNPKKYERTSMERAHTRLGGGWLWHFYKQTIGNNINIHQ